MAVWPSRKVVKSWASATGIALLRGMTFSTRPPMVSRPSESGVTSSSNQSSSPEVLPASLLACIAAPIATTLSGSMSSSGAKPKNFSTAVRTQGMRVAPPTSTTPRTSETPAEASRRTASTVSIVFLTRWQVIASNSSRVRSSSTSSPLSNAKWMQVDSSFVRASFAARESAIRRRFSAAERMWPGSVSAGLPSTVKRALGLPPRKLSVT